MEAKLIKIEDGYELFTQGFLKGSTNHGLIESLNIEEGPIRYKLSIKNCQAIERGYDLDELAKKYSENIYYKLEADEEFSGEPLGVLRGFKDGFQKALEILNDKKFSEADVINIAEYVRVASQSSPSVRTKYLLTEYQSQEQTEWDVEVEMEKVPVKMPGIMVFTKAPKLDEDGCLILKRI